MKINHKHLGLALKLLSDHPCKDNKNIQGFIIIIQNLGKKYNINENIICTVLNLDLNCLGLLIKKLKKDALQKEALTQIEIVFIQIQYIQFHNLFGLFADFVASRRDKQFFEVELSYLSHQATAFIEVAGYLNLYSSEKSEDYVKFLRLIVTYAHFLKFGFILDTITNANDKTILKKNMAIFISIDFNHVLIDLELTQSQLRAGIGLNVNTIKHIELVRDISVKFKAYQEYLADLTSLKKLPSLEY